MDTSKNNIAGVQAIKNIFSDARNQGRRPTSFEMFPPKGELGVEDARAVAAELSALNPDFISVTCSAGGSGNGAEKAGGAGNRTVTVAQVIQDEFKTSAMAHLTCYNATEESIFSAMDEMKSAGIINILALRGDPIPGVEPASFHYAKDLIPHLKDAGFCVGAAAYPEGHISCTDPRANILHLKQKQDAGADFFVTQLFFDNNVFYRFWEDAQAAGITVPITCGIMPFMSKSQIQRMVFMCGASLPSPIIKLLARYENDENALMQAGIEYANAQLTDLDAHGVDGLHIYAMNRPSIARAGMTALEVARCAR